MVPVEALRRNCALDGSHVRFGDGICTIDKLRDRAGQPPSNPAEDSPHEFRTTVEAELPLKFFYRRFDIIQPLLGRKYVSICLPKVGMKSLNLRGQLPAAGFLCSVDRSPEQEIAGADDAVLSKKGLGAAGQSMS